MRPIKSHKPVSEVSSGYIPDYIPSLAPLKTKTSSPSAPQADRVTLSGGKNKSLKPWTVMFYLDGDNDMAPMAMKEFRHIRKTGSDENVNLVGFLNLKGAQNAREGLITKDPKQKPGLLPALVEDVKDTVLQFLPIKTVNEEEVFPGSRPAPKPPFNDPQALEKFVKQSIKKYPAQHYALVVWNQGTGYAGNVISSQSEGKRWGRKLDVVDLNASLLAQTEIAYQLRDDADYLVSSQELQKSDGVPISKIVNTLKAGIEEKGEITPRELARLFVFECRNQFGSILYTPTQSATDIGQIEKVAQAADRMALALVRQMDEKPQSVDKVRKIIKQSQHFVKNDTFIYPAKDYVDIGDFARRISADKELGLDPQIKQAASQLLEAAKNAVTAEHHTTESADGNSLQGSTGLSVYLPDNYGYDRESFRDNKNHGESTTHGYENTDFAKNTNWEVLLKKVARDNKAYEVIQKFIGKHPLIDKIDHFAVQSMMKLPKIYHWANYGGYGGAMYLMGASKPAKAFSAMALFWCAMGFVGGAFQGSKGAMKMKQALTAPYGRVQENIKLLGRGGYDVANAAGMIVFSAAMYAGISSVAWPAAAALLTLGVGKLAYQGIQEYRHMARGSAMNVDQKLQRTVQDNHKRFQNMEIA